MVRKSGVNDRYGKEIYEGDKVFVFVAGMTFPGSIIYKDGEFQFKHRSPKIEPTLYLADCEKIEVIDRDE